MDDARQAVELNGQPLTLTAIEYQLLKRLAKEPGRIYSRNQLMEHIYQDHRIVSDRTVDSHIKKLRKKAVRKPHRTILLSTRYTVWAILSELPSERFSPNHEFTTKRKALTCRGGFIDRLQSCPAARDKSDFFLSYRRVHLLQGLPTVYLHLKCALYRILAASRSPVSGPPPSVPLCRASFPTARTCFRTA